MVVPKPRYVIDGEPWWDFHFSYTMDDGKDYGFTVCARSEADAKARLATMSFARYDGQGDGGPIPLSRGGIFVPLMVWWRNLQTRKRVAHQDRTAHCTGPAGGKL